MNGRIARMLRKEAWNQDERFAYKENEYIKLQKRRSIGNRTIVRQLWASFYNYLKRKYNEEKISI